MIKVNETRKLKRISAGLLILLALFALAAMLVAWIENAGNRRHQVGVLGIAGEATMGFYYEHKRFPTSKEIKGILRRENSILVPEKDQFFVEWLPDNDEIPVTRPIRVSYLPINGQMMRQRFSLETSP